MRRDAEIARAITRREAATARRLQDRDLIGDKDAARKHAFYCPQSRRFS
jgi:hypothetical protein